MANNHSIIREVQNGIEFFTIEETGESGMSQSGLARFCGVDERAIRRFISDKKDAILDSARVLTRTGKTARVKIVKDTVCAEAISHYAQQGKPEAIKSLIGFAAIGIRSFIHSQTGWTPAQQSVHLVLTDIVSRDPQPWELHFSHDWIKNAERLTGWKWEYRVMGKFIKANVYDYMPIEVQRFLDEHNPLDANGQRPNKHHQHFTQEADPILRSHIKTVLDLMEASVSLQQFEDLMQARFKNIYQLRFESMLSIQSA